MLTRSRTYTSLALASLLFACGTTASKEEEAPRIKTATGAATAAGDSAPTWACKEQVIDANIEHVLSIDPLVTEPATLWLGTTAVPLQGIEGRLSQVTRLADGLGFLTRDEVSWKHWSPMGGTWLETIASAGDGLRVHAGDVLAHTFQPSPTHPRLVTQFRRLAEGPVSAYVVEGSYLGSFPDGRFFTRIDGKTEESTLTLWASPELGSASAPVAIRTEKIDHLEDVLLVPSGYALVRSKSTFSQGSHVHAFAPDVPGTQAWKNVHVAGYSMERPAWSLDPRGGAVVSWYRTTSSGYYSEVQRMDATAERAERASADGTRLNDVHTVLPDGSLVTTQGEWWVVREGRYERRESPLLGASAIGDCRAVAELFTSPDDIGARIQKADDGHIATVWAYTWGGPRIVLRTFSPIAPPPAFTGYEAQVTLGFDEMWRYETPLLPDGKYVISITGSGDADLYVRAGAVVSIGEWQCRPYTETSDESCSLTLEAPSTLSVLLHGYAPSSTVTFSARVQ